MSYPKTVEVGLTLASRDMLAVHTEAVAALVDDLRGLVVKE